MYMMFPFASHDLGITILLSEASAGEGFDHSPTKEK